MLPRPSARYLGFGPLMLAQMTHEVEGEDDIEFLAIQDAVERLTASEREMYQLRYIDLCRRASKR